MSFIWIGTEVPLPGHDIGKSIAWTVEAFFVESKDIYIKTNPINVQSCLIKNHQVFRNFWIRSDKVWINSLTVSYVFICCG